MYSIAPCPTSATLLHCCGRLHCSCEFILLLLLFLPVSSSLYCSPPPLFFLLHLVQWKQLPWPLSTTLLHCYGRLHCSSDLIIQLFLLIFILPLLLVFLLHHLLRPCHRCYDSEIHLPILWKPPPSWVSVMVHLQINWQPPPSWLSVAIYLQIPRQPLPPWLSVRDPSSDSLAICHGYQSKIHLQVFGNPYCHGYLSKIHVQILWQPLPSCVAYIVVDACF